MISLLLSTLAVASPLYTWDFETDDGGLNTTSGLQFEWGPFTGADPSTLPGGSGWATGIDTYYLNDAADGLLLPGLDLSGTARPVLGLHHFFSIEDTDLGDSARLETLIDGEWTRLEPVYGYPSERGFAGFSDTWRTDWFDLSGLEDDLQVRLYFVSGLFLNFPGWYIEQIDVVDGDPIPPLFISADGPADTQDLSGPYQVTATAIDDHSFPSLTLFWQENSGEPHSMTMSSLGYGSFEGHIPGQQSGTDVSWWIEASDGVNTTTHPDEGSASFRVALPAPTDLQADDLLSDGRIAAEKITLRWASPLSDTPIAGFEIARDSESIASSTEPMATVKLKSGPQAFTVSARFLTDEGLATGDASLPLWVHAALPYVDRIEPKIGWPGDRLRVDLHGNNLYLSEGMVAVEPGTGLNIEELTVIDANHIRSIISINESAEPGTRQFTVTTGNTVVETQPVFTVLSADDRPQVIAARPPTIRQGASTTIFIDLGVATSISDHAPEVNLGTGVFVEGVRSRSTGFDVDVVVAIDAPLGDHAIEIDDGERLLTGATITVRDNRPETKRGCSQTPANKAQPLMLLTVLAGIAYRRRKSQQRT